MPFHNHMSEMSIKLEGDKVCKLDGVLKLGIENLKLGVKCVAHSANTDMKMW